MRSKNTTPNYVCLHCGTPFFRKRNASHPPKFCSLLCSNRYNAEIKRNAPQPSPPVHIVGDGTAIVRLSKGLTTLIDESDAATVSQYTWHASKSANAFYARAPISSKTGGIQLHRLLLSPPEGMQVDHINGDTLDNRRSNLRVVTASENMKAWAKRHFGASASGYRGVYPTKNGKWLARLYRGGRLLYLGSFDTPEDAAEAVEIECVKWDAA